MISKKFKLNLKSGLHLRPAGYLVKKLQVFDSEIFLRYKDVNYNAKSILGIIGAGIPFGKEIEFIVNGSDEEIAMDCISKIVENNFTE